MHPEKAVKSNSVVTPGSTQTKFVHCNNDDDFGY